MGEAKRRGTQEERIAAAVARDAEERRKRELRYGGFADTSKSNRALTTAMMFGLAGMAGMFDNPAHPRKQRT